MEWLGRDCALTGRRFFDALKPGGHVVVAGHAGNPGTGVSESQTPHRVEESAVRGEFAAAGFELVAEEQFLRNPRDPRTESFRQAAVPSDRFVRKERTASRAFCRLAIRKRNAVR
jgi:predicted methyltransferase